MFDFGKSLMTMDKAEQKKLLEKATPAQRRTAYEQGVGIDAGRRTQTKPHREERQERFRDLDRLNHVTEKENEAHDVFSKGLDVWSKGLTGNNPSGEATALKKQFDDFEQSLLSEVPEGGKRHTALAESLPSIKSGFLKQGHAMAMDKLNQRSRSVLDKGLQRIAHGALGAKDDDTMRSHDEAAYALIDKYVQSEATFDQKDGEAMFDAYLKYSGGKPLSDDDATGQSVTGHGGGGEAPETQQADSAEPSKDEKQLMKGNASDKQAGADRQPLADGGARSQDEVRNELARQREAAASAAERIRHWERDNGASVADVEEHYRQKPGPKPTWMKENLGKTEYYEDRARDFEERNPGKEAPDYYREYGDKYVRRFDELKPQLSPEGQQWLGRTKDLLQFKMESGLRSGEWDETKPEELKEKAYDSHSEAYLEAGLAELPPEDVARIVGIVDRLDMTNESALWETMQVFKETGFSEQGWAAFKAGVVKLAAPNPDAYDEVEEMLDTSPY